MFATHAGLYSVVRSSALSECRVLCNKFTCGHSVVEVLSLVRSFKTDTVRLEIRNAITVAGTRWWDSF
jgi:hypothetical protein